MLNPEKKKIYYSKEFNISITPSPKVSLFKEGPDFKQVKEFKCTVDRYN